MSNDRNYGNGISGNYANGNGNISTDNSEEDLDIRLIGGGGRMLPNFQSREVLPPNNSPRSSPTFHHGRDFASNPSGRPEESGPSSFGSEQQRSATSSSTSSSRLSPISVDTSFDGHYGGQPFTMQSNDLLARVPIAPAASGSINISVPTTVPSQYFPFPERFPELAMSSGSGSETIRGSGGFSSPGELSYSSGGSSSENPEPHRVLYPQRWSEPYPGLYPESYAGELPVPSAQEHTGATNPGNPTLSDAASDFRIRPEAMDLRTEPHQYRAIRGASGGPTEEQLPRNVANSEYESFLQQQRQRTTVEHAAALPGTSNAPTDERPISLPGSSNTSRPASLPGPSNTSRPTESPPRPPFVPESAMRFAGNYRGPLSYLRSDQVRPDGLSRNYTRNSPSSDTDGSSGDATNSQLQAATHPKVPHPLVYQSAHYAYVYAPDAQRPMQYGPNVPPNVRPGSDVPVLPRNPHMNIPPNQLQFQQQRQPFQPHMNYPFNEGDWTMSALLRPQEFLTSGMHPNVYRCMSGRGSRMSPAELHARSPMNPYTGSMWQPQYRPPFLGNENVIGMFSNMSVTPEPSLEQQYQRYMAGYRSERLPFCNPAANYTSGDSSARSSSMSLEFSSGSPTPAAPNRRGRRGSRGRRGGRGGRGRNNESTDDSRKPPEIEAGGADGGEGSTDTTENSEEKASTSKASASEAKDLPKNLPRRKPKNEDPTSTNPYQALGRMRASASPELDVSINFLNGLLSERSAIENEVIEFKNFFADYNKTTSTELLMERLKDFCSLYLRYEAVQEQIELFVSEDPVVDEMERSKFDAVYIDILSRVTGHIRDIHLCSRDRRSLDPTICMHWLGHSLFHRDHNPDGGLPLFDGSCETWLEFHDMYYHLVYRNPKLTDEEKYHRLDSSVVGELSKYIRSQHYFEESAYQVIWSVIKDKQDSESNSILKHHRRAISALQPAYSQTSYAIRKLLDGIAYHDSVMTRLGEPPKNQESAVQVALLMKLDGASRHEFCRFFDPSKSTKEEIMDFVEKLCKRLCIVDDDRI